MRVLRLLFVVSPLLLLTLLTTSRLTQAEEEPGIYKSVDRPLAGVGEDVVYTLTIGNPSNQSLTDVVITDAFDARLEGMQVISSTHGQATIADNILTLQGFDLPPGQQALIQVAARISERARPGDAITNTARLESPQISLNSNTTSITVLPATLPATGEAPDVRLPVLLLLVAASLGVIGVGLDTRRRRMKKNIFLAGF